MATAKIQKGDSVKIIAGSYKGQMGVVTQVVTKLKNNRTYRRASVSVVPEITKYRKANKAFNIPGQMLTTQRLIDVSNLMVVDEKGKASRVQISIADDGKKTRLYATTKKAVTKADVVQETPSDKKKTTQKEDK